MLAAMHSGAGKTAVTCGLLGLLKARRVSVGAFKCGPDYIDPMFHTRVLGVSSRNLDLFLQGQAGVCRTLSACSAEVAILEGAMGFYDGLAGTDTASAWQLADFTDTPVILILRPKGSSLTLAAQVQGMLHFRPDSHIAGLLLNDCKPGLYAHLAPILERETGLPVLGYLPPMAEADFASRHLGLLTAAEIENFAGRFHSIAAQMEQTVRVNDLLALAAKHTPKLPHPLCPPLSRCRIAVAQDEAFCFYYQDNLDALEAAGADLVFFSPLHDDILPQDIGGLYLGGGYPELYAESLSKNWTMRESILLALHGGLPVVAECGGFLYLQSSLQGIDGRPWPMVGVLPGEGIKTSRLQRFGYLTLTAGTDSLLFRSGEVSPAHEFHYWDSTGNGADFTAKKGTKSWRCGAASSSMYAAFPHLHFGGALPFAQRFADCAAAYQKKGGICNGTAGFIAADQIIG